MCERCVANDGRVLSRRGFVAGAAGLAAVAAASPRLAFAQDATPQNAISPDEALKRLLDGNARYVANAPEIQDYSAGRAARAISQHPIAAIVSCADSRVAPELAFDQGPGDLFVVRVAGNFITPAGLASLEFGVKVLSIPLIMVLGHSSCGAISATIDTIDDHTVLPGHLPDLVQAIRPAVLAAKASNPKDLLVEATAENVRFAKRDLTEGSAIIADAVGAGDVQVVGGVYNLSDGKIGML
jgi:carbonic anhydrase